MAVTAEPIEVAALELAWTGVDRTADHEMWAAVRRLLASGWNVSDVDIYMASEPGLIDPLSSVPSPALA
jgi:hypothetical protein